MRSARKFAACIAALAALVFAACGGGEPEPVPTSSPRADEGGAQAVPTASVPIAPSATIPVAVVTPEVLPPGTGELQVRVTDAPPEGVSAIVVTISGIQVHKAGAGEEERWISMFAVTSTAGTATTEPMTFDLVQVTGIEQVLGTEVFAVGKYTQIRMDVDKVVVTFQPRGGTVTTKEAEVPGDRLKVVRPFDVEEGQATILTLDFDADKSVVITGQGDVRFKPVVKLLTRKEDPGKPTDAQSGQQPGRPGGPGQQDRPSTATPVPTATVTLTPQPAATATVPEGPPPTATQTATQTPQPAATPTRAVADTPTPTLTPNPPKDVLGDSP